MGKEKEEEGCLPIKGEGALGEVSRAWMSGENPSIRSPMLGSTSLEEEGGATCSGTLSIVKNRQSTSAKN